MTQQSPVTQHSLLLHARRPSAEADWRRPPARAPRRAGTVIVLGESDIQENLYTCTSAPTASANFSSPGIPNVCSAPVRTDAHVSGVEETGSATKVACFTNGQVNRTIDPTQSFDHNGALTRWAGSLKVSGGTGCGAAVVVGGQYTAALRGVPLSAVTTVTHRVFAAAGQVAVTDLRFEFDFDTNVDTIQCPTAGCGVPAATKDIFQVRAAWGDPPLHCGRNTPAKPAAAVRLPYALQRG